MTSLLLDARIVTLSRRVKWQGRLEVMFFVRCAQLVVLRCKLLSKGMPVPRADSEHSGPPRKCWGTMRLGGFVSPAATTTAMGSRRSAKVQPGFPRAADGRAPSPGGGQSPGLGAQGAVPSSCSHLWWHLAHATVSLLRQAHPGVFPEVVLQMLWLYESRLGAHPARQALAIRQEETRLLQDAYIFRRHCLIT